MIAQAFRGPHNLYRRYQASLESTLTAAGLGALIGLTLFNLAVYPNNWIWVIGVAIAVAGIRWPLIAYMMAVAVTVYPIYIINLYLAVLFVAISVLGHRLFVHYLGGVVLILATPLLAKYHLHWLAPILAGLWWGGVSGAWIGALAAIWGKIVGGMAGMNIDWLVMAGQTPEAAAIMIRFQEANSLETLLLLVEPFAATSSVVLYNLLQILGWATTAGFVGSLAHRKWVKYHIPWSVLVLTAGGGLIMLGTHLGLPYWLQEAVTQEAALALQDRSGPLFSLIVVIVVGTTLYSLRELLDLPVAPPKTALATRHPDKSRRLAMPRSMQLFRRGSKGSQRQSQPETTGVDDMDRPRRPVRIPTQSELPEWEPPKDDTGLIMLEID